MEQLPVPAPKFTGESRVVDANRFFAWLQRGWLLFVAEPAQWLLMTLVLLVIMLGLSVIPFVGSLAAMLLTPVFVAGMLYVAQRVDDEQYPAFESMFAGFSQKPVRLMILGALYTATNLLIMLVLFLIVSGAIFGGAMRGDIAGVGMAIGSVLVAFVLSMIFSIPVMMAMWFAPALVFFEDASPIDAVKASFNACWKNIVPFIVYGLLMFIASNIVPLIVYGLLKFIASIVAALLFMLGFLIFLPVLFGSMLASYKDIFASQS